MMDEEYGSRKVLEKAQDTDFVEVMYAKSLEEAKACCSLLEEEGITARYEEDPDTGSDRGIAILVAEERLIEASEVLSSRVQHESTDEDVEDVFCEDDVDDADEGDELDDDDDDDDDFAIDDDDDEEDEDDDL